LLTHPPMTGRVLPYATMVFHARSSTASNMATGSTSRRPWTNGWRVRAANCFPMPMHLSRCP